MGHSCPVTGQASRGLRWPVAPSQSRDHGLGWLPWGGAPGRGGVDTGGCGKEGRGVPWGPVSVSSPELDPQSCPKGPGMATAAVCLGATHGQSGWPGPRGETEAEGVTQPQPRSQPPGAQTRGPELQLWPTLGAGEGSRLLAGVPAPRCWPPHPHRASAAGPSCGSPRADAEGTARPGSPGCRPTGGGPGTGRQAPRLRDRRRRSVASGRPLDGLSPRPAVSPLAWAATGLGLQVGPESTPV